MYKSENSPAISLLGYRIISFTPFVSVSECILISNAIFKLNISRSAWYG